MSWPRDSSHSLCLGPPHMRVDGHLACLRARVSKPGLPFSSATHPNVHAQFPTPCLPPPILLADPALGCLTGHTDYVTGLAASQSGSMLASGGLQGEVLLWDIAGLRQVMSGTVPVSGHSGQALRPATLQVLLPCLVCCCCLQVGVLLIEASFLSQGAWWCTQHLLHMLSPALRQHLHQVPCVLIRRTKSMEPPLQRSQSTRCMPSA